MIMNKDHPTILSNFSIFYLYSYSEVKLNQSRANLMKRSSHSILIFSVVFQEFQGSGGCVERCLNEIKDQTSSWSCGEF